MTMVATVALLAALLGGVDVAAARSAPALFPDEPGPPPGLAAVRPGLLVAAEHAALAGFVADPAYVDAAQRQRLVKDAGGGATLYVLVAHDVVARIGIELPAAGLVARLTRQWGTPVTSTSPASEGLTSWLTPAWKVDLACRAARCRLAYHRRLSSAFFGRAVAPPAGLAAIERGMTVAQLARVAPAFVPGVEVPAGPEDVRLTVDMHEGRLRGVRIGGLPAGTDALLVDAWGPATSIDGAATWFNPGAGWRARYDAQLGSVFVSEYMPVLAFLGPGPELALPMLGRSAAQLAQAFPRFEPLPGGGRVRLPPTELTAGLTLVAVRLDPGSAKVAAVLFALPYDTAATRAALIAALERKWGPARTTAAAGATRWTFTRGTRRTEVVDAGTELRLDLR